MFLTATAFVHWKAAPRSSVERQNKSSSITRIHAAKMIHANEMRSLSNFKYFTSQRLSSIWVFRD